MFVYFGCDCLAKMSGLSRSSEIRDCGGGGGDTDVCPDEDKVEDLEEKPE